MVPVYVVMDIGVWVKLLPLTVHQVQYVPAIILVVIIWAPRIFAASERNLDDVLNHDARRVGN